jgi:hypothetical protein
MLKQTARFTALALVMFAAIATSLNIRVSHLDSPLPMPDPLPPVTQVI